MYIAQFVIVGHPNWPPKFLILDIIFDEQFFCGGCTNNQHCRCIIASKLLVPGTSNCLLNLSRTCLGPDWAPKGDFWKKQPSYMRIQLGWQKVVNDI